MEDHAVPPIVGRDQWRVARDALLEREKAHTREGDAIAAARRRLPMTAMPPLAVRGPDGDVPLIDVFEGRTMLLAYFHMFHDGEPLENQCEGCTFSTCHMGVLDYLHARGVTYAVFCEGGYDESVTLRDFMGYNWPWYSSRDADPALVDDRGYGMLACYLRHNDRVYETYWTTGRGVEAIMTSYHALDLTIFGRQETWEDSPEGWPRVSSKEHPWRLGGRPIAQWSRTREPVAGFDVPTL